MNKWTDKWPQKEGLYWFYGRAFRGEEPDFYMVKVWKGMNSYAYITEGHFMYKQEGAQGVWMKLTLPDKPDEKLLNKIGLKE